MSYPKVFWILLIIVILIIIGCLVSTILYFSISRQETAPVQTPDPALVATFVAQTIEADLTEQAVENTVPAISTPQPNVTETSTATQTPVIVVPTGTAVPATVTTAPPTNTPVSTVCDRAQFVRDLSVQDDTPFAPGSSFVKTWRLKNVGYCTWTTNYRVVFQSGDAMDADTSIPLPKSVEPNQTIDISVAMRAPNKQGTYRGDWMLSNSSGNRFGIGSNGNQTFWVQVRVINLANPNLAYDFAANYCRAEWSSAVGHLPCPGTTSSGEGFVILLDDPQLENRNENELALWTHPNSNGDGWISGMYPEFTIQPNQHFKAWVGCLADSKGCKVVFRLEFYNLNNGVVRNLGSWEEAYDGQITQIDLDLSPHAGKRVRFILRVEVNGGDPARANAFWFVPGIVQISTPTPTQVPPTPTETPTQTPTPTEQPTETLAPTEAPTETPTLSEMPTPTET
jgi:hypothetical protein